MPLGENVQLVLKLQANATKRGVLTMWTVYDRPTDYPSGFCARRYELTKEGPLPSVHLFSSGPRPDELREIFREAGLVCIPRQEGDDPVIVETWI